MRPKELIETVEPGEDRDRCLLLYRECVSHLNGAVRAMRAIEDIALEPIGGASKYSVFDALIRMLAEKRHSGDPCRNAIFKRDGYRCRRCGSYEQLSIDHIVPRSKGGTDDLRNLQTLCHSCNARKGVG